MSAFSTFFVIFDGIKFVFNCPVIPGKVLPVFRDFPWKKSINLSKWWPIVYTMFCTFLIIFASWLVASTQTDLFLSFFPVAQIRSGFQRFQYLIKKTKYITYSCPLLLLFKVLLENRIKGHSTAQWIMFLSKKNFLLLIQLDQSC